MNHTIATNATSESARAGASTASIARSAMRRPGHMAAARPRAAPGGARAAARRRRCPRRALPTAIAAPPTGSVAISASRPRDGQRERERSPARLARGRWAQVAGGGAHEARANWRRRCSGRRAGCRGGGGRRRGRCGALEAVAEPLSPLAEALRGAGSASSSDRVVPSSTCAANVIVGTSSAGSSGQATGSEGSGAAVAATRSCGAGAATARCVRAERRGIRRSSASANPAAPSSTSSRGGDAEERLRSAVAVACSALLTCSTSTRFLTGTCW